MTSTDHFLESRVDVDNTTRSAITAICEGEPPNGLDPDARDPLAELYRVAVDGFERNGKAGAQAAVGSYLKANPTARQAMAGDPKAQLEVWTADRLLTEEFPEPVWAVPDLLPVGLGILAGRPKVGKSWLALQIAQAVATGGRALGQVVKCGPVLYLALEDPPRRLQTRMHAQHWPRGTDADFLTLGEYAEQMGDLRGDGGKRLAAQIERRRYRLVVIDTLSRAIFGDQNDAEVMTAALTPIQEAAHAHEVAILVIDHHRKGFGGDADAIGDILGSTAKGAMLDTAWGLYRERGRSGAKLQVVGRDVEERTLALHFDPELSCWQSDGDADELDLTERREEIIAMLRAVGPMGATELARAIDQDKGNTYRRLQDLVGAGQVVRDGNRYAVP